MLKVFISYGETHDVDYSRYIASGSIQITKSLNTPTTCSISMSNYDDAFVMPPQRCYVRIWSMQYKKNLFTGFLTNDPSKTFVGMGKSIPSNGQQMYAFKFAFTSDEYLLNIKSVPFIPAFINQSQGHILRSIAEALCPGFYNFDYCTSGDIVPYLLYDPSKSWSEIAKEFGDASRFHYSAINKEIHYQPYGDGALGISYDEDKSESTFSANSLKTAATTTPIVNDVTIVGQQEAGNNHEDFFIGDGFRGDFPLKHQAFGLATAEQGSSILINEPWSGTSINSQYWSAQDPSNNFNYNVANTNSLNVITGFEQLPGTSFIVSANALELAGGLSLQHGEFVFNDTSDGVIGAIYDSTILNGFNDIAINEASCEAGFRITPTASVVVTASGASGISITPWRFGAVPDKAFNVITKENKSYVLTTNIIAPKATRYTQVYRSMAGSVFGNVDEISISGSITWSLLETDMFTAEQTAYTFSIGAVLPVTALYVPINNYMLNLNVTSTEVTSPIPGSLNIKCEIGAGLLAPIYISGNVQYTGGFVTPSGGNLPIAPSGIGPENNFALGTGLQNKAAELDTGQVTSTLNFYGDALPGVGVRIRLQSWESQAAIARLRDSSSVATEAGVVGDDGVRASIVTNLTPLPRTSEDCEAAAQAFLHDRVNTFYQGTYNASYYFFNQFTDDIDFYPTCGRYLFINAPRRNLNKAFMLVTSITTTVTELAGEIIEHSISFGPDLFLEKLLASIIPTNTNQLTNLDSSMQPPVQDLISLGTTFYADVSQSTLSNVKGATVNLLLADAVPAGSHYEVRNSDLNWGVDDGRLVLASGVTGSFVLSRTAYDQSWYIRFVSDIAPSGTDIQQVSRRAKVLRVMYPRVPTIPAYLYIDSNNINLDFTGDIRNIEGVELRGPVAFSTGYANASGAITWFESRPLAYNFECMMWSDFFIANSAPKIPSDAVITAIIPVILANAVFDSVTSMFFGYGTGASLNVAPFNSFFFPYNPNNSTFTDTLFYGASIGNNLAALVGQSINVFTNCSLFLGPPLIDAVNVKEVGLAIYYTSANPTVDSQLSLPIPPGPNVGVAWAIPATAAYTGPTGAQGTAYATPAVSGSSTAPIYTVEEVFYQGIVGSQADMALDLTTLRGQSGPGQPTIGPIGFYQRALVPATQRDFVAYFFNLMWEYGPGLNIHIPPPAAPELAIGFKFSASLQILDTPQDVPERTDYKSSILQVATDPDFVHIVVEATQNGNPGNTVVNVPTTGDLYARLQFSDFISSGAWSATLFIPNKDLISSTYLNAQGSISPYISNQIGASGGIFTYEAEMTTPTDGVINMFNIPFGIVMPDGSQISVPSASASFLSPVDAPTYQLGTQYGFFPVLTNLYDPVALPMIVFEGPFLNYAVPYAPQFIRQFSDGTITLTNGPFFAITPSSPTIAGGGGGGTQGGGNCGVLSSKIELADGGCKTLANLTLSEYVKTKNGKSKVIRKDIMSDTTYEVTTKSGCITRAGQGHVVKESQGSWIAFADLHDKFLEDCIVFIETANNKFDEVVTFGKPSVDKICHIYLKSDIEKDDNDHVYILDGIWSHNVMIKVSFM